MPNFKMDFKFKKVIVFDFDHTLNKINLSMLIKKNMRKTNNSLMQETLNFCKTTPKEQVISELFLNPQFLYYLKRLRSKGLGVCIASYGYHEIINTFLVYQNIRHLFDEVITPLTFGYVEGIQHFDIFKGKNKMLDHIGHIYNMKYKADILLIDDNPINIWYAGLGNYPSIMAYQDGLKLKHVHKIKKFLKN